MSLLDPGALAWLSLLPLVVLLYLMKLRRRDLVVPACFLWRQAAREARVDSFFHRLRSNLLLYLQLLILALLILALARPYLATPTSAAPQLVLMLDTSASMQAAGRFEKARRMARRLLADRQRNTEVMLVTADRQIRVVVPFTTDRARLARALAEITPRDVAGDLEAARSFAASVLASRSGAEAFLFGDRSPPAPLPGGLRFVDVGSPGRNVGLAAFSARLDDRGRLAVLAAVQSWSPHAEEFYLEIERGGHLVEARHLTLRAGARQAVIFHLPAQGDPVLQARLTLKDDLEVDNRAWTVTPTRELRRILTVGPPNPFVQKALEATGQVRLEQGEEMGPGFDLVVWTRPPPWPLPGGSHFVLAPPRALLAREGVVGGPFALSGTPGHPLLADLSLAGVALRRVLPLKPPDEAEVVARAGPHPAILVLPGAVVLGFDLFDSDFPLTAAFPIFINNVVDELTRGGAAGVPSQIPAGLPLEVRTSRPVTVEGPDGTRQTLLPEEGVALWADTGRTGIYRLTAGHESQPVAVNLFDAAESDLSAPAPPQPEEARPSPAAAPETPASGGQEVWASLAALALGLLMGEWYLYHRRRP